jgi:hypothetical protein
MTWRSSEIASRGIAALRGGQRNLDYEYGLNEEAVWKEETAAGGTHRVGKHDGCSRIAFSGHESF